MPPWKVSLFTPDNKILLSWGTPAFLRKTRPVLNTCLASFYAPSCSNKKLSTCRALSSFLINVQKGEPFLINVQKGEPFLINIQKGEPFSSMYRKESLFSSIYRKESLFSSMYRKESLGTRLHKETTQKP